MNGYLACVAALAIVVVNAEYRPQGSNDVGKKDKAGFLCVCKFRDKARRPRKIEAACDTMGEICQDNCMVRYNRIRVADEERQERRRKRICCKSKTNTTIEVTMTYRAGSRDCQQAAEGEIGNFMVDCSDVNPKEDCKRKKKKAGKKRRKGKKQGRKIYKGRRGGGRRCRRGDDEKVKG